MSSRVGELPPSASVYVFDYLWDCKKKKCQQSSSRSHEFKRTSVISCPPPRTIFDGGVAPPSRREQPPSSDVFFFLHRRLHCRASMLLGGRHRTTRVVASVFAATALCGCALFVLRSDSTAMRLQTSALVVRSYAKAAMHCSIENATTIATFARRIRGDHPVACRLVFPNCIDDVSYLYLCQRNAEQSYGDPFLYSAMLLLFFFVIQQTCCSL